MTIATKRMLKILLWMLLIALNVVGFMAVSNVTKNGSYTVDTQEFTSEIEWGEDISIGDIKIIDNRVFGLVETTLTEDMIVSIEDTSTAGQKKVVFEHNNKQFTVFFNVKYKIEFVSYGKVVDTQMVVTPDELNLPTPEARTGYEFSHWDYDFSQGFTQSVQINAVFKETKYPALNMITATYGDTLADLELPYDYRGKWEFLEPLDTPVGDVGKNFHNVRFVFNGDDSYYKYSEIEVKVNKKELQFTVDDSKNIFTYDGLPHSPTNYSLDCDVDSVVLQGGTKTDVGKYSYKFEIIDDKYYGSYYGEFEIIKPTVTVNVSSAEVVFDLNLVLPEFTYTVEGFELVELLNIEIAMPERTAVVGEYEVGIDLEKANPNVNYIVNKGVLTVLQAEYDPDNVPEFKYEIPTYGDKLEDLVISGFYQGDWDIETKDEDGNDIIIDDMSGISFYATYTPHNTNYKSIRVLLQITEVNKKTLTIEVLKSEFVYEEGVSYQIIYKIVDENGNEYTDLAVTGNDPVSTANTYERTIRIDDEKYDGLIDVRLIINKATPKTEFDKVIEITWKEGLDISNILPNGYAWKLIPSISGIGEYEFDATYTPEDTANYVSVNGKFKVKVLTAEPSFSNLYDIYTKVYDTQKFDIKNSGIFAHYMTVKPVIKYYVGDVDLDALDNAVEIDEIINTGTYTVVISIAAEGNYHATTVKRSVTVTPAENKQTVDTEQKGKYLDSTSEKLTLPENIEGTWSWSIETLDQMGEMTLIAIFTPDSKGNHEPRTEEVTVTVEKKPIPVPDVKNKQYTGAWIDIEFSNNELYSIGGDISAQNYGTYTATFTLKSPDKYEWIGFENDITASDTYKVTEAPNDWVTKPQDTTKVYDPNGNYMVASAEHGTPTYVYKTLDGTVVEEPLNAGEYYVTVIVAPLNYEYLEETVKLVITQATVPTPSGNALTYNGSAQNVTITNENLGKLYDYVAGSYVSKMNAGETSSVVVRLSNPTNYKWDKVAGSDYTVSVTISKATLSFAEGSKTTLSGKSTWTYTEAECTVNKATLNDTAIAFGAQTVLMYSTDNVNYFTLEDFSANNKTNNRFNAGKYYVKTVVLENTNWKQAETEPVIFTVNRAKLDTIKFAYTGDEDGGLYYKNSIVFYDFVVYFGSEKVDVETIYSKDYILVGGFNGANTKVAFNVTPKDLKNFESAELVFGEAIPLKTVATIYRSGSEFAKYGTIEEALENATSGDIVWVNMDDTGKVCIKENVTVKYGVTLLIPYAEGKRNESEKAEFGGNDEPIFAYTNVVTVNPGVIINVASGATLEIGGQLQAKGAEVSSGHTAGSSGRIILGTNASIVCNGIINCYGFIDEDTKNNGSSVVINNGANISVPFIIFDFRGGTATSGINANGKHAAAVFNRFAILNVVPTFVVNYGGEVYAMGNLYADDKINSMKVAFVGVDGASSSPVLQLTDPTNSKIIGKLDTYTQVTHLEVIGGAKTAGMSLSVASVPVTTADFAFGIGPNWDIVLRRGDNQTTDAIFTMAQLFKLMPGAKLTVDEGAVLNITNSDGNAAMNVYPEGWKDTWTYTGPTGSTSTYDAYPTVRPGTNEPIGGAMLIVRGTLNADILGGNVYLCPGASINVTTKKCTTKDLATAKWGVFGGTCTYYTMAQDLNVIHVCELSAGETVTLPTLTRDGYSFAGWFTAVTGGTLVGQGGAKYTADTDMFLYAQWQTSVSYTVTFNANGGSCGTSSLTTGSDGTVKLPEATYSGRTFNGWYTATSGGELIGGANAIYTPSANITLYAQWTEQSDGCVTPDTLITLADGTQVRVDSLTGDEMLLVWNLETGRFDFAPIMFVDREFEAEFNVVYLHFSDGTVVKVIYEHGFWNYDLNKYVYLDENASLYIGHTFAKQNGDKLEKVELVNVEIKTERITAWSPVTVGHLCYFVNGMLSMPGGVEGLFNIFDVDADTMTYDYEAMERDIEKYGLFTYEELNAICPLSEDMFNAAGGAYLKISIGKGNLTMEELVAMIERYSKYI